MIRHVVMWKFRPGCEAEAEEFLTRLAALKTQIPWIRAMSVERSVIPDSEFDAVLLAEFDSPEDVNRYKADPRHQAVSALCRAIRTARCAIDTEL